MRTDTLAYVEDTLAHAEDTLAHPDGHAAENLRARSRIHSPTLSGPSATDGPPRPGDNSTRQLCDHGALVPLPDRTHRADHTGSCSTLSLTD